MTTMLTLTVQLALATAVLPATPSASMASSSTPSHVRIVAQGWVGQPRTAPPPPPPAPAPAPVVAQPRVVTAYPTQAPPPPMVERFAPRRGWVWVGGHYDWNRGRYMWVGGHWERERAGFRWEPGRWDWQANRYVWIQGNWIAMAPPPPPAPPPGPMSASATIYLDTTPPPPPAPIVETTPAPRAGFYWIPGAHVWRGGRYVWLGGHWEPVRQGHHWRSGLLGARGKPARLA